jgi:6-phosphofructokinase 2
MTAILTLTMNPAVDVSASTNKVAPGRKIRCSNAYRDPGGADIVALTLGDAGATLVSRDACIRASPLRVKIMSAVGAGDSFLGAMVWRLSSDGDLEDALRHGVAAGTAALLTLGTGLCRRDDAVRLVQQVELSR